MTNDSYKNENRPPQDLTACAGVIMKTLSRKYLVVKQNGGLYGFPKGHMNTSDKNLKATAIRELEEETGLVIKQIENDSRHYIVKNVTLFTHYVLDIIPILSSPNNEIESIHWLTLEEMVQLSKNKQTNITINEFLRQHKHKDKDKSKMFTGFCSKRPHKREKNWRSV
jgi:8-oxo-dGTP pyrophosphatase MutT (NUDIX family)